MNRAEAQWVHCLTASIFVLSQTMLKVPNISSLPPTTVSCRAATPPTSDHLHTRTRGASTDHRCTAPNPLRTLTPELTRPSAGRMTWRHSSPSASIIVIVCTDDASSSIFNHPDVMSRVWNDTRPMSSTRFIIYIVLYTTMTYFYDACYRAPPARLCIHPRDANARWRRRAHDVGYTMKLSALTTTRRLPLPWQ